MPQENIQTPLPGATSSLTPQRPAVLFVSARFLISGGELGAPVYLSGLAASKVDPETGAELDSLSIDAADGSGPGPAPDERVSALDFAQASRSLVRWAGTDVVAVAISDSARRRWNDMARRTMGIELPWASVNIESLVSVTESPRRTLQALNDQMAYRVGRSPLDEARSLSVLLLKDDTMGPVLRQAVRSFADNAHEPGACGATLH